MALFRYCTEFDVATACGLQITNLHSEVKLLLMYRFMHDVSHYTSTARFFETPKCSWIHGSILFKCNTTHSSDFIRSLSDVFFSEEQCWLV